MKKEDMLIFVGTVATLTGLTGLGLGWAIGINQVKDIQVRKQGIEDRKGKCVEYEKRIDPVSFSQCEYCIKWEDKDNPGLFIYGN